MPANRPSATILLVEDDAHLQRLLRRILIGDGYTVLTADHGLEALDHLTRHHVDLVVTDGQMPQMSGDQLIVHLRANHPGLRILALSGGDKAADPSSGAVPSLFKPFELQEFLTVVRDLLAY